MQAVLDRIELLRSVPRMGKVYRQRSAAEMHQIVSGKYRIFYNVLPDEQRIEILAVWHSAWQEPDLPN